MLVQLFPFVYISQTLHDLWQRVYDRRRELHFSQQLLSPASIILTGI